VTRRGPDRGPIDWGEVRRRLEQGRRAGELVVDGTSEQGRAILRARAAELARPLDDDAADEGRAMLAFFAGGERYVVDLRHVREVADVDALTRVPGSPAFVLGLVNLRGEVVCVADLPATLGRGRRSDGVGSHIVALGRGGTEIAVAVDEVERVQQVRARDILPLPGRSDGRLCGILQDATTVLDAEALLDDEELYVDGDE